MKEQEYNLALDNAMLKMKAGVLLNTQSCENIKYYVFQYFRDVFKARYDYLNKNTNQEIEELENKENEENEVLLEGLVHHQKMLVEKESDEAYARLQKRAKKGLTYKKLEQ